MSRIEIIGPYGPEPDIFSTDMPAYGALLSKALNWYTYEKEKKDARVYLREYISTHYGKPQAKLFDRVPDNLISNTLGWLARITARGSTLSNKHQEDLQQYVERVLKFKPEKPIEKEQEKKPRPSVRENMEEKVREYLGELEGALDEIQTSGKELDLYNDLKSRTIPQPYCTYIESFITRKSQEYIAVYESTDSFVKESYSNLGKRKLTQTIKMLGSWMTDLERYGQFKKANRKPRAKKVKSPSQQVAKLKYKKEDTELGLKSVTPSEIVGASQVWVYNIKYKKLAVYRSDSTIGIQVKGSTLQNYDPDQCEQKTLRKPKDILKEVLEAGKVKLRRIVAELTTKESPVNGRINEECIIVRVIK